MSVASDSATATLPPLPPDSDADATTFGPGGRFGEAATTFGSAANPDAADAISDLAEGDLAAPATDSDSTAATATDSDITVVQSSTRSPASAAQSTQAIST